VSGKHQHYEACTVQSHSMPYYLSNTRKFESRCLAVTSGGARIAVSHSTWQHFLFLSAFLSAFCG
jgi:hypothetical protein